MHVFVERVGHLYRGEAWADDGRVLVERTEPLTADDLEQRIVATGGEDDDPSYEFDCAIYAADERTGDSEPDRFFFLLGVRAEAGTASDEDGAWVVDQLRDPNSIHRKTALLWTLGFMGPQYESSVAPFLDDPNVEGEAECAMTSLFRMGLHQKYADRFVAWMRGSPPADHRGYGNMSYGAAPYAFKQSRSPKILKALIDASNDASEKWTTREHARACLALAIDIDNAPIGTRMPADHPYYAGLLEKAELLLQELHTEERDAR